MLHLDRDITTDQSRLRQIVALVLDVDAASVLSVNGDVCHRSLIECCPTCHDGAWFAAVTLSG